MGLRTVIAIAIALVAGACTDTAEQSSTTTTRAAVTTSSAPAEVSVDTGRLVVVEADGSVAVIDPDGSGRVAIAQAEEGVVFTQPIWSPDSSQISYGRVSGAVFAIRVDEVSGEGSMSIPVSNNPFFMHWSPDGESLGVLHNGNQGLDFELVDVSEGTISVVDRGSPFYFSWSPSGDRVVIHEGAGRFETVDLEGARSPLGETDAGYLVPQWLPQGILHVVDDRLVLVGDGEPVALAGVGEQTMFVANPQGTRVAVQTLGAPEQTVSYAQTDSLRPNAVAVIDTATSDIDVIDGRPVVGLWWSPDGESLLLLTPISGGSALMAKVWSEDDGLVEYSRYRPSPIQARDLLPFFPQYAQSMTFWSPDSSGFAIAGEVGGEIGIWVHQLGVAEPRLVSDGFWVAWSGE